MKFIYFLTLSLVLSAATSQQDNFVSLHALEGTWKMNTKRGPLFERWKVVGAKELLGTSFKINNSDTLVLENIQLVKKGNDIFYIPSVQDQNHRKPIPFRLISAESNRFVFENPDHDFPQRIIYTLVSRDSITARIEGKKSGVERSSDFSYNRE